MEGLSRLCKVKMGHMKGQLKPHFRNLIIDESEAKQMFEEIGKERRERKEGRRKRKVRKERMDKNKEE